MGSEPSPRRAYREPRRWPGLVALGVASAVVGATASGVTFASWADADELPPAAISSGTLDQGVGSVDVGVAVCDSDFDGVRDVIWTEQPHWLAPGARASVAIPVTATVTGDNMSAELSVAWYGEDGTTLLEGARAPELGEDVTATWTVVPGTPDPLVAAGPDDTPVGTSASVPVEAGADRTMTVIVTLTNNGSYGWLPAPAGADPAATADIGTAVISLDQTRDAEGGN